MASAIQLVGFVTCAFLLAALVLSVTSLGLPQWVVVTNSANRTTYGLFQFCTSGKDIPDQCRGQHEVGRGDWLYGSCAMMLLCTLCNLIALSIALSASTCRQNKKLLFAVGLPALFAAVCGAIAIGIWAGNYDDMLMTKRGVTLGVALWLAVASLITSVIAVLILLVPVCVDHDAKDQTYPTSIKAGPPPQYAANGIDHTDHTMRRNGGPSYSDPGYNSAYQISNGYGTKPKYVIRDEPKYVIREEPKYYGIAHNEPRYMTYSEGHRNTPNYISYNEPRYIPNGYRQKEYDSRPHYISQDDGYIATPRQVIYVDR